MVSSENESEEEQDNKPGEKPQELAEESDPLNILGLKKEPSKELEISSDNKLQRLKTIKENLK